MKEQKKLNEPEVQVDEVTTAKAMIAAMFEQETLYFELVTKISDNTKKTEALSKNLMKMKMSDQIKVLTLASKLTDVANELCDKYDLETEGEV